MGFLVFLLCLVCGPAQAFINIESLRQNPDQGFNGSSGLELAGASGNVRVFNMGVNSQNIYQDNNKEYIFILNYNYGEASREKNNNKGNFHLRYAQSFSKSWMWETFGQAEFNEFQALKLRTLVGGGVRWGIFDDSKTTLYLGLGTFYENEDIDGDTDQANFRGNIYLSFRKVVKDGFETVLVLYYQPNYEFADDYRIQATSGIETKVTEVLQIVNSFTFTSDTRPPMDIQKEDFTYKVVFNFSY